MPGDQTKPVPERAEIPLTTIQCEIIRALKLEVDAAKEKLDLVLSVIVAGAAKKNNSRIVKVDTENKVIEILYDG